MKDQKNTIGVVAKKAGVGVETVRFYERKEIIQQPQKSTNGFRYYCESDIKKIRLVKKLQEIGFSLNDIKGLLIFDSCCNDSKQIIKQKF